MPFTKDQLDNWFTYHPPTDETAPKYDAVRRGQLDADFGIAISVAVDSPDPDAVRYGNINAVTRNFAEIIDANAPDSADKTAAIRCVRLARNAANEAVANPKGAPRLAAIAATELQKARWQANSAIACGGK
jgi:hypothetical protein